MIESNNMKLSFTNFDIFIIIIIITAKKKERKLIHVNISNTNIVNISIHCKFM